MAVLVLGLEIATCICLGNALYQALRKLYNRIKNMIKEDK